MGLFVGVDLSGFGVISCSLLGLLDGSLFVLLLGCLRLWLGFTRCVGMLVSWFALCFLFVVR